MIEAKFNRFKLPLSQKKMALTALYVVIRISTGAVDMYEVKHSHRRPLAAIVNTQNRLKGPVDKLPDETLSTPSLVDFPKLPAQSKFQRNFEPYNNTNMFETWPKINVKIGDNQSFSDSYFK